LFLHSWLGPETDEEQWYHSKLPEPHIVYPEEIKSSTFPDNEFINITHASAGNTNIRVPPTCPRSVRIHHGVCTARRSILTRFPEHMNTGEDGMFCRKVCWDYSGVIFVDSDLMIYFY